MKIHGDRYYWLLPGSRWGKRHWLEWVVTVATTGEAEELLQFDTVVTTGVRKTVAKTGWWNGKKRNSQTGSSRRRWKVQSVFSSSHWMGKRACRITVLSHSHRLHRFEPTQSINMYVCMIFWYVSNTRFTVRKISIHERTGWRWYKICEKVDWQFSFGDH